MRDVIDAEFVEVQPAGRVCPCPSCDQPIAPDAELCGFCDNICVALVEEAHRRRDAGDALLREAARALGRRVRGAQRGRTGGDPLARHNAAVANAFGTILGHIVRAMKGRR